MNRLVSVVLLLMPAIAVAKDTIGQLDELMRQYHELNQFNGSVLVVDSGTIVLRKGYGFANSPDTRFGIGSMSKSFTALVVLQLAERGELDLDATISDYLPSYRRDVGKIVTLRQLLTHTDGIPDYTQNPDFRRPDEDGSPETTREYVSRYCSGDLAFEPGTQYLYGNAGYSILGAIIERVTGKDFTEVVAEQVIEPHGLQNTGFIRPGKSIEGIAHGYEQAVGGTRPVTPLARPLFAAGSMYSTIDDVATYGKAVVDAALISEGVSEALLASRDGALDATFAYGWDTAQTTLDGAVEEQHIVATGGELNGFNSLFVYLPRSEQLVVLLNNTGETNLPDMAANVLRVINGHEPEQPRPRLRDTLYELLGEGMTDAAIQFYRDEREANPADYIYTPWALRIIAGQLSEDGRTSDAIRMLELNLETNPDDVASAGLLSQLRQQAP